MRKKRVKLKFSKKVITIIVIIIIFIISFILLNKNNLKLELKGKEKVILNVGHKYKDKGCIAKIFNKDISNKIKKSSNLKERVLGTYEIKYSIKKIFFTKRIYRKVKVIDKEKPIITLKGESEITLEKEKEYKELGYSATDNYDGDITKRVKINGKVDISKIGTYELKYSVKDSSNNEFIITRKINIKEKEVNKNNINKSSNNSNNLTYIKGILIVNKKYSLPEDYDPGVDSTAYNSFLKLQSDAKAVGHSIPFLSGFRSYSKQQTLYNNYVAKDGVALADTYSARPGHSEHQTGLAFDVGEISDSYGETNAGIWLKENCHKYGFIIRYLKGKENITGYKYEPWHIRYVGIDVATNIMKKNITLEEYLGL